MMQKSEAKSCKNGNQKSIARAFSVGRKCSDVPSSHNRPKQLRFAFTPESRCVLPHHLPSPEKSHIAAHGGKQGVFSCEAALSFLAAKKLPEISPKTKKPGPAQVRVVAVPLGCVVLFAIRRCCCFSALYTGLSARARW